MTQGGIAILTTCGGILIAMIGVWVELVKHRRAQSTATAMTSTVVHEVTPNSGGSLRDAVNRIETAVTALDGKVDDQAERLVRVETRMDYMLPPTRRSTDGRK